MKQEIKSPEKHLEFNKDKESITNYLYLPFRLMKYCFFLVLKSIEEIRISKADKAWERRLKEAGAGWSGDLE